MFMEMNQSIVIVCIVAKLAHCCFQGDSGYTRDVHGDEPEHCYSLHCCWA